MSFLTTALNYTLCNTEDVLHKCIENNNHPVPNQAEEDVCMDFHSEFIKKRELPSLNFIIRLYNIREKMTVVVISFYLSSVQKFLHQHLQGKTACTDIRSIVKDQYTHIHEGFFFFLNQYTFPPLGEPKKLHFSFNFFELISI